jgi:hypothetical protein
MQSEKRPRPSCKNFYCSQLEIKGLRYAVERWLEDHRNDRHSDFLENCWICQLWHDFLAGEISVFQAHYLMSCELQGSTTCDARKRKLSVIEADYPDVRCCIRKNGYCRCKTFEDAEIYDGRPL